MAQLAAAGRFGCGRGSGRGARSRGRWDAGCEAGGRRSAGDALSGGEGGVRGAAEQAANRARGLGEHGAGSGAVRMARRNSSCRPSGRGACASSAGGAGTCSSTAAHLAAAPGAPSSPSACAEPCGQILRVGRGGIAAPPTTAPTARRGRGRRVGARGRRRRRGLHAQVLGRRAPHTALDHVSTSSSAPRAWRTPRRRGRRERSPYPGWPRCSRPRTIGEPDSSNTSSTIAASRSDQHRRRPRQRGRRRVGAARCAALRVAARGHEAPPPGQQASAR